MKQRLNIAFTTRINVLLCSSAAVLLAACGGASDGSTGPATQTAAYVEANAGAGQTSEPNAADAGAATRAGAASNDFAMNGYETNPLAGAGSVNGAIASAAAAAQPRLLASVASVDTSSSATSDASAQVTQLYQSLLGRAPDAAGLAYWTQAVASGTPLSVVEAAIRSSDEYASIHPGSSGTASTVTVPATTYNYYVSPNGSDTAAGTKAAPFKTLARAVKAATKGSTTVFVAPGTYAGGIKTTASGTASARIYWVSTTKWGAKIVPPSSSSNNNAWDNRGNYVSIIGFDVDGTNSGSGTKWTHGIYTGGSYTMIADNHIHNIAKSVACTSAGGSAIGVDSYYNGVMSDVVSNVVNDIGPSGCSFVQGIYFSTSGTIKNNLSYRVSGAAIHLWHDATSVIIANNTAATSSFGMVVGGGDFYHSSAGANNVFVANNIVYDNQYGISEQGKTGTSNQYKNNLVYKNVKYDISLRNGLKATATVSSDPLLKAYSRTAATPDFHPSSSSPAIGRGIATNAYPTDLDGKPRNSTTGYDIGAYQH